MTRKLPPSEQHNPDQIMAINNPVGYLDTRQGVVDPETLPDIDLDLTKRNNLTMLSGVIGVALAAEPRKYQNTDEQLDVYPKDFANVGIRRLESGLYIPNSDTRYYAGVQVAKIDKYPPTITAKGVVGAKVGVVVSSDEFKKLTRSPSDFSQHIQAGTRKSIEKNRVPGKVINVEEEDDKAARSAIHALEAKLNTLAELDELFVARRALFARLYRDTQHPWRTAFKNKNLVRDFIEAQEHIHDTAKLATLNLRGSRSTSVLNAMHRAIASRMFREPDTRRAANIRSALQFVGLYTNAKRGKISQSVNATLEEMIRLESLRLPHVNDVL